jgi:hypothetical protein
VTTVASFVTINAFLALVAVPRASYNRGHGPRRDLQRIAMQEERLALPRFDASARWTLGSRLKAMAEARGAALAIEVRLARRTVFFHAMAGSRPSNADWARRKCNTVELLAWSSYRARSRRRSTARRSPSAWACRCATSASPAAASRSPCRVSDSSARSPCRACPSATTTRWSSQALAELAGVPLAEVALD